jgi:poly(A) polymerase
VHPALVAIRNACLGTSFENEVFLVGGAVRDEQLFGVASDDFDLVTVGNAIELAHLLFESGVSEISPVTFERFGTAMIEVQGVQVELITARKESYDLNSRKPEVEPGSYLDDSYRRDFTINTLMCSIFSGELIDPLGVGLSDLHAKILMTPLDPGVTFSDDPLRMLRAIRFRNRLGFDFAEGLSEAIQANRARLKIISFERIRDELLKMLSHPSGAEALREVMELGLFEVIAPEFIPMIGCTQGNFHYLDVWDHTLKVVEEAGVGDPILSLGAFFHDVGKPETRSVEEGGKIRFFAHESVGASMTTRILKRWKLPLESVERIARLVKNHMRLSHSDSFSDGAVRRLVRDLGDDLPLLLDLVAADLRGCKAGVASFDLQKLRDRIEKMEAEIPSRAMQSPLTGEEIMNFTDLSAGKIIGDLKDHLTELVIEGELALDDKEKAKRFVMIRLAELGITS